MSHTFPFHASFNNIFPYVIDSQFFFQTIKEPWQTSNLNHKPPPASNIIILIKFGGNAQTTNTLMSSNKKNASQYPYVLSSSKPCNDLFPLSSSSSSSLLASWTYKLGLLHYQFLLPKFMVLLQVFTWNLKICNYKSFNIRKCIFFCDCNSFFNVGNAITKILKNVERFFNFYYIKKNPQPFEELKASTLSNEFHFG